MRRSPKLPRAVTVACNSSCSPKNKRLSHSDFSPWAHQALPFIFIGIMRKLTSQEDFDPAMQKIACRRVSRADGLSFDPAPSAKEPCGKTRVLLNTTRSSGRSNSGRSRKRRSRNFSEARSTCSRREAARSGSGSWAMRSSGSEKLKSETSTLDDYRIFLPAGPQVAAWGGHKIEV